MNKFWFFLTALLLCICHTTICLGQQKHLDSLVRVASATPDSIERCRIYLELSQLYQKTDTLKSSLYRQKANTVLAQFKADKRRLQANLVFAKHHLNARLFDEALNYTYNARALAKQTDTKKDLATTYYYSGCIYLSQGNSKKALDDFIQSYKLANAVGDNDLKAHVNSSFGVIYQQQGQLDSALLYYKKSFSYFESTNSNTEYAMVGSQNIGNILLSKGAYAEGQSFMKRALDMARQRKDINAEMIILGNMSNGYEREGNLNLAEFYAAELVKDALKTGFILQELYGKTLLSTIKLDEKKYDEAILRSQEALALAEREKVASFIVPLYEMLVSSYEQKKDYKHAYDYKNRLVHVQDSLADIENTNYIEEIKQKYNLQQKNQELQLKTQLIQQIEKSDKQKTVIIISLLVILASAALSVFLYRQRRKIKDELERKNRALEHQNKNFEAFINGQDEERKRIASDLHDGLAQHLVMLKMGILNFNLSDSIQQEKLNFYSDEIDKMIEETRKISHNMMPGVLVDLGLLKAMKSLITEINANHLSLKIALLITDPFVKLSSDIEIQVYRIIQELLNNVIKHSGATHCEISLTSTASLLSVDLKDNGTGFEKDKTKKGIGLQSIHSRVTSLNGKVTIDSALNKGTTVSLRITVKETPWKTER
jgi:two-component system NarL family sensor kinase